MTSHNKEYVAWLQRQGATLYKSENAYWQLYKRALIPVSIGPKFLGITNNEGWALIGASGALFLRYSSDPSREETPWWYIVCDDYDPKKIGSKIRQNINRGTRSCSSRRIQPKWLAENGYACYQAAYGRYKHAAPVSQERFKKSILMTAGGPFEWWGVFVRESLAGYCQCVVEGDQVNTSVTKYDPAYLKQRTAYSLVSCMIDNYVVRKGMVISNGNRALVHNTNYQEFLVNLGFRRQFCRLNIIYRPWLEAVVKATLPFHRVVDRLPDAGHLHALKALLFQEDLRRVCRRNNGVTDGLNQ